eukprot:2172473-Pyramimonas_sp.AAC.1
MQPAAHRNDPKSSCAHECGFSSLLPRMTLTPFIVISLLPFANLTTQTIMILLFRLHTHQVTVGSPCASTPNASFLARTCACAKGIRELFPRSHVGH